MTGTAAAATGRIDAGIAAGVDTVSDAPVVYTREYQQLLLRALVARFWKDPYTPPRLVRCRMASPPRQASPNTTRGVPAANPAPAAASSSSATTAEVSTLPPCGRRSARSR